MSKVTLPIIRENVLLNIELSTNFYFRIKNLFNTISDKTDKDTLNKVIENLKEQKNANSIEEETLMVLLALIAVVEEKVKQENLYDMKEVDINED